jgi:DNA-binding CsgD family transcriptional regulator
MNIKDLSFQDMKDILQVVGAALEIEEAESQLSEVLRFLENVFQTGSNNFFFAKRNSPLLNIKRAVSRGIEKKYINEFDQYYHSLDPLYKAWSINSAASVVVSDHSKIEEKTNEYYHEFLKPQSINYQMSLYLRCNSQFLGVLSLFRSHQSKEFTAAEQTKAKLLAPYLSNALEKAMILEQKAEIQLIVDSVVNMLSFDGVMVLDSSLDPVYQDQSASSIITEIADHTTDVSELSERLPAEVFRQCEKVFNSAGKNSDSSKRNTQLDFTIKSTRGELPVHLRLISPENRPPLLLIGFDKKNKSSARMEKLKKMRLSQREFEVVDLLAKGLKNKEIGKSLFISEYTVENHLRAIYRKMEVKNRTEATHKVMQFD